MSGELVPDGSAAARPYAARSACRCGWPTASSVPARLITFHGLGDGREHVALGLGDRAAPTRGPSASRWCACTASA